MTDDKTTPCRKPWRYDSGQCNWPACGCNNGQQITKMKRKREQWSGMSPKAVVAGSEAQVFYCVEDARSDIISLYAEIDRLREALMEASELIEGYADANHNGNCFVPNNAMRALQVVSDALGTP